MTAAIPFNPALRASIESRLAAFDVLRIEREELRAAAVSIVVASPTTQTFTSTVTLPQMFINKPGTNPLLVGNGATLQTGNFTIQDGTVDLNGGTLVVNGNFSVGTGTAADATNVPNFICSTVAGSQNGPAHTFSRPWAITSANTTGTSVEPPEPATSP